MSDAFQAGMYVWADYEGVPYPAYINALPDPTNEEGLADAYHIGFHDGTSTWMPQSALTVMTADIADDDPRLTNELTREEATKAIAELRTVVLEAAMSDDDDEAAGGADDAAAAERKAAKKAAKAAKKEAERAAKEEAKREKEAKKAAKKAAEKDAKPAKSAKKSTKKAAADDEGSEDDLLVAPGVRLGAHRDAAGSDSESDDDDIYEHQPGPKGLTDRGGATRSGGLLGQQQHQHRSSRIAADGLPDAAHQVLAWANDEYVAKLGEIRSREAHHAEMQRRRDAEEAAIPLGGPATAASAAMPPPTTEEKPGSIVLPIAENTLMMNLRRRLAARASYDLAIDESMKSLDKKALSPDQVEGVRYAEQLLARLRAYHTSDFSDVAASLTCGPPSGMPPRRAPPPPPAATDGGADGAAPASPAKRALDPKPERHNGKDPLLAADRADVNYDDLKPAEADEVEIAMARQSTKHGAVGSSGGRVVLMQQWATLRKKARGQAPSSANELAAINAALANDAAAAGGNRYQVTTRGPTRVLLADFAKTQTQLEPAPIYSGIQKSASFDDVLPSKSADGISQGFDAAPASVYRSAVRQSVLPASTDIFAQNTPLAGMPFGGDHLGPSASGAVSSRGSHVASRASSVMSAATGEARDALEHWRTQAKAVVRKVLSAYYHGTNGRAQLVHSDPEFQALAAKLLARLSQRVIDATGAGAFTRAGGANASGIVWTEASEGQIVKSIDDYMTALQARRQHEQEKAARRDHDPRREGAPGRVGVGADRGLALTGLPRADSEYDSRAASSVGGMSAATPSVASGVRARRAGESASEPGSKRGRSYTSYTGSTGRSSSYTSSFSSSSGGRSSSGGSSAGSSSSSSSASSASSSGSRSRASTGAAQRSAKAAGKATTVGTATIGVRSGDLRSSAYTSTGAASSSRGTRSTAASTSATSSRSSSSSSSSDSARAASAASSRKKRA